MSRQLETERHDQELHAVVRRAMLSRGATEAELAAQTLRYLRTLVRHGKPTSAGGWLLSLPPEKLKAQLKGLTSEHPLAATAESITSAAPARGRPGRSAALAGRRPRAGAAGC